jgi:hypothetical protein
LVENPRSPCLSISNQKINNQQFSVKTQTLRK